MSIDYGLQQLLNKQLNYVYGIFGFFEYQQYSQDSTEYCRYRVLSISAFFASFCP